MQCITNNSIKHQSFVSVQLNDQTVLLQTIQFAISTRWKCQPVLFDPWIRPYQVLPFRARVDLRAMAMKGTRHSPNFQHYWNLTIRLFRVIFWTLVGRVLPHCWDAVGVFYSPSRQGQTVRCLHPPLCHCSMHTLNTIRIFKSARPSLSYWKT